LKKATDFNDFNKSPLHPWSLAARTFADKLSAISHMLWLRVLIRLLSSNSTDNAGHRSVGVFLNKSSVGILAKILWWF